MRSEQCRRRYSREDVQNVVLDESGRFIDPAKVSITGDIMKFTMQGALTKVGAVATNNVGTTKQLTVPKVALSGDTAIRVMIFPASKMKRLLCRGSIMFRKSRPVRITLDKSIQWQ